MSLPKPKFAPGTTDPTAFCGIIDGNSALPALAGQSYGGSPDSNTQAYTTAFKQSQYKTLKDLVMAKTKLEPNAKAECGFTVTDGEGQDVPASVEWSHGSGEGFTPSHMGPCEVWCDDERVFQDDNCAKNFPQAPARLPIEAAKCKGKSTLKTIWMALHSSQWQVYINCAKLNDGSPANPSPSSQPSSSPSGNGPSNQPSNVPSVLPVNTTVTGSSPETSPSTVPFTPAPSKTKKCNPKKFPMRQLEA
ncbi:TPA: hypothetical protein N0F65_009823 [Lagenidium giganteum]|uniref:Uncharacterized protein n=1 Tax=Lagenidium giganteum TaxID=4803 RepID=A0AAV2YT75_9STRA|nr:TPA: hypothetical protein N0F65_009823 [Lagenidium giganteum]